MEKLEGGYNHKYNRSIIKKGSQNEIMRCIHIALLCVQENLVERPIMATVVLMLSSYFIFLSLFTFGACIYCGRQN